MGPVRRPVNWDAVTIVDLLNRPKPLKDFRAKARVTVKREGHFPGSELCRKS